MIETLGEAAKLREREANEEAKLCDLQEELVQLAAVLCGDHHKDEDFPQKLLEGMTVAVGADYVNTAFHKFLSECQKARNEGADDSTICIPQPNSTHIPAPAPKSFASKLFSCIFCASDWL